MDDIEKLNHLIGEKFYYQDEHFETLLQYLRREKKENDLEMFCDWIKQTVTKWCTFGLTPPHNVLCFVLKLGSLLSENEKRFRELSSGSFLLKLVTLSKIKSSKLDPGVRLAYTELLMTLLEHQSGVERLIACHFWDDILYLGSSNQNRIELVQLGSKFLSKVVEHDIKYCSEIIKLLPLDKNAFQFFENILIDTLERRNFGVAYVFWHNFRNEDNLPSKKIPFILKFIDLRVKIISKTESLSKIESSLNKIKRDFLMSIPKDDFYDVMNFCSFGVLFWKLVNSEFGQTEEIPFSNQLVVMFILPNYSLVLKYILSEHQLQQQCIDDEFRDLFTYKIISMHRCYISKRLFFFWRERLISNSDLFTICTYSLLTFKKIRIYFVRSQAVAIFQTSIYLLKDIIISIKKTPQKFVLFRNHQDYIWHIFDLLSIVIEEFQITWRDSFEAVDVMDVSFDFLKMRGWSVELTMKILKLINVSTRKYMTSSLVLMIEDSTLVMLGYFMCSKLNGEVSKVQEGALEVVQTMACMSRSKFPSLQKVLMDSELPTLVVKMSTCDGESFVRATAIKCLQEMIQVEEIWNNALKSEDLSEKMRHILMNETEGIVRVEAATFMCVAYEHQQFPKESLDGIYETMIYSSTTDLHWEVKVRALNFWDKVIKNHLQNQGMIDDSFPNVTFSKEHRKIVTLTDSEIRKRLLKVLSQLSSIGCLGVLMSAIKDDCDMEVSKTGVKITQRLIDLFKKYNVRSDSSTPSSPAATENGMSAVASVSSGISVDESMDSPASTHPEVNEEVIDQIVNSKDVCLLKNVYTPSDYGSVSNYDIQVRKIVTPNEFLVFCQQDLNSLIAEKKNWLNGIEDLGSLLDDMLKTYDDDVNNMDCY